MINSIVLFFTLGGGIDMRGKKLPKGSKRILFPVYFSEQEKELVKMYADRVSPYSKKNSMAGVIRATLLAHAENPDLDWIHDPGVCLEMSKKDILMRQYIYKHMKECIDILKANGIDVEKFSDTDEGDEK